jgi:hypothetical protein
MLPEEQTNSEGHIEEELAGGSVASFQQFQNQTFRKCRWQLLETEVVNNEDAEIQYPMEHILN